PVHLKRNEIAPSLSLQRQIFPFVEDALWAPGTEDHRLWVERCQKAMEDVDDNREEDLREVSAFGGTEGATRGVKSNSQYATQTNFLLMLVRMGRIILQDAAAYDHIKQVGPILQDPLFASEEIKAFQNEVQTALRRDDMPMPADLAPGAKQVLANQQLVLRDLMRQIEQERQGRREEQRQWREEQRQWQEKLLQQSQLLQDISRYLHQQPIQQQMHHEQEQHPRYQYGFMRNRAPTTFGIQGQHYPPSPVRPPYGPSMPYHAVHSFVGEPAQRPQFRTQIYAVASPDAPRSTSTSSTLIQPFYRPTPQLQPSFRPQRTRPAPLDPQPPPASLSETLPLAPFCVRYETQHMMGVQEVWDEYQEYMRRKERGEKLTLAPKESKMINNRKRVIEEIEYRKLSKGVSTDQAIDELQRLKRDRGYTYTNHLVDYCRRERDKRRNVPPGGVP
ncbi:hypothetical protein BGZ98_005636, partial [Dissophora globulifera]